MQVALDRLARRRPRRSRRSAGGRCRQPERPGDGDPGSSGARRGRDDVALRHDRGIQDDDDRAFARRIPAFSAAACPSGSLVAPARSAPARTPQSRLEGRPRPRPTGHRRRRRCRRHPGAWHEWPRGGHRLAVESGGRRRRRSRRRSMARPDGSEPRRSAIANLAPDLDIGGLARSRRYAALRR